MESIITQLVQARDNMRSHLSLIPDDLTSWNLPGISKLDIESSFNRLIFLVKSFNPKNPESVSLMKIISSPRITTIVQNIAQFPQNPQAYLTNIFTQLASLSEQFLGATTFEGRTEVKRASKIMLDEISSVSAKLIKASSLYEQLTAWAANIENQFKEINKTKENLTSILENVEINHKGINASLESTNVIIEKIKEKNSLIDESENHLRDVIAKVSEIKTELIEQTSINKIQQKIISDNLEDSNRVGMASSFNKRKSDLTTQLWIWGVLLILSLASIALLGKFFILPDLKEENWLTFLFKLPITAPFIWLAWFSGIQYRYNSTIREDYAFKNATAMAFEGYRKEVASDPLLTKELLEKSITTFSENPLRLFEKNQPKETPIADLAEKVSSMIEKNLPEILKNMKTIT